VRGGTTSHQQAQHHHSISGSKFIIWMLEVAFTPKTGCFSPFSPGCFSLALKLYSFCTQTRFLYQLRKTHFQVFYTSRCCDRTTFSTNF